MPLIRWQFVAEPFYRAPLHVNVASPVIRWFGAGDVSHVDTIIPGDFPLRWAQPGELYGARASADGARKAGVFPRRPDYAVFSRRIVVSIPALDEQCALWWQAEREKYAAPYDSTAIWGFALGRDWRAPDSWFCSEKQADSAIRAGIMRPLPSPISKVTPPTLLSVVSQVPGVVVEEVPP